jgi:hypothetical protein
MQGLFLLKNLTEIELIDAVKTSARAYLFAARNYDEIDVIDFMLEKWADLNGFDDLRYGDYEDDEDLDDEVDPSRFLRVFSELIRRGKSGLIESPDLKKAVSSVKLIAEFEMAAADESGDDMGATIARRLLKTLDQPVPGRLRVFLGSLGLAPR